MRQVLGGALARDTGSMSALPQMRTNSQTYRNVCYVHKTDIAGRTR